MNSPVPADIVSISLSLNLVKRDLDKINAIDTALQLSLYCNTLEFYEQLGNKTSSFLC